MKKAFTLLNRGSRLTGNLTGLPCVASAKLGFTLIELLIVMIIIGILASLSVVSLNSIRVKSRDLRRITDIKAIGSALDLYNGDEGVFPLALDFVSGRPIVGPTSGRTYLKAIPANPAPRIDGACPDQDYTYTVAPDRHSYTLSYCLANKVGDVPAGQRTANQNGLYIN